jgi:hypothetical protein
MGKTITSSNSIVTLAVSGLFDAPRQLQQFSADDIFTTDPQTSAETAMGLDNHFTAGFVYNAVVQHYNLMADSDSCAFFEQWDGYCKSNGEVFYGNGVIILPSIGKTWSMQRGVITSYPPLPDAAKTLRSRRFSVTWGRVSPAESA